MNKSKAKAAGVTWVKPAEPSFLKKFKKDVGYKEGPSVETKMQTMPDLEDDSGSDREDELPQVVVLKGGDLSAEDVKKIKDDLRPAGDKGDAADGKILFKKPAKRSSSDKFQGIKASSSKKKKKKKKSDDEEEKEEEEGEEVKTEVKTEVKSGKKVKNTSLLSFGEDEEEDEEN